MGRVILDRVMHKLPSTRKLYRVALIVPDNGVPVIEYYQVPRYTRKNNKPRKTINFVDLWYTDRKHDTNEKHAFSVYMVDKTVTFLAQDETTMNEWLTKIREYHSNLYPEITQYDAIFEANLLERGLGKTQNIQGPYRLALCKESLDLIPIMTPAIIEQIQQKQQNTKDTQKTTNDTRNVKASPLNHHHHSHHEHTHPPQELVDSQETNTTASTMSTDDPSRNFVHLDNHIQATNTLNPLHQTHLPQRLPSEKRFSKRHPFVTQRTIQLPRRYIKRCGHSDSNFYVESGRWSMLGGGDLWFGLNKKSTAKHLHELLLATIKSAASQTEDQLLCKASRSRSGSSSENVHLRPQQSPSSSLNCLNNNGNNIEIATTSNNNNNNNTITSCNQYHQAGSRIQQQMTAASNQLSTVVSAVRDTGSSLKSNLTCMFSSQKAQAKINDQIEEDNGYLPMA